MIRSATVLGFTYAVLNVLIECVQFVYFGNLFQRIDPIMFGFLVFAFTSILLIGWTAWRSPKELRAALANPKTLIAVNFGAVVTFSCYLLSVQLIEPAITYTVSAGTMPLSAFLFRWLGMREGGGMRNKAESLGLIFLTAAVVFLAIATVAGYTGFTRGGLLSTFLGVIFAMLDGVFFTLILVYSHRLNVAGVGPAAVLGLRMPLFVIATGTFSATVPHTLSVNETALFVVAGFLLTIPPLYLLQKAVPLVSTSTLSTIFAFGPFVVLALQIFEGRVDFATATLLGLCLYSCGALLSAYGAISASRIKKRAPRNAF